MQSELSLAAGFVHCIGRRQPAVEQDHHPAGDAFDLRQYM
jgi:hypothetical protein